MTVCAWFTHQSIAPRTPRGVKIDDQNTEPADQQQTDIYVHLKSISKVSTDNHSKVIFYSEEKVFDRVNDQEQLLTKC